MLIISKKDEFTLWFLIQLILRKAHWILLTGITFALAVYLIVTFGITPTYESRVSFYVYNTSNNNFDSDTINPNDLQAAESLATTYSKILSSNSVLDMVLHDLEKDTDLTREELSQMVETSVVTDTQLLEVVISSNDADLSCEVADAFVDVAPSEIERITKAGSLEVVDRPEVAKEKSSPRTIFDTGLGFLIGVMVCSALIILRKYADTTIYLPEDIKKVTDVTILGQIPTISKNEQHQFSWHLINRKVAFYDAHKNKETEIE